ncbi:hypothetical protein VNI00_009955 [Paramarasmius palmivorus]|uniref:Phosphatases II n=1 Tax=Paramarasmius palmivorus TaxID=297713 RepID=A0AAW0CPA2_9AGAR
MHEARARFVSLPRKSKALRAAIQNIPKSLSDYYAVVAGNQDENQYRNRYVDVVPYDRTRVVVVDDYAPGERGGEGRYCNANWVLERFGGKWWIASQAPLPNTSHTFLSLIAKPVTPPSSQDSSRVRTVVQLTQNLEDGRRKAHPYFPEVVGQHVIIHPEGDHGPAFEVKLEKQESIDEARCVKSTVSFSPLNQSTSPIIFQHLLYYAWPDRGIPEPEDRDGLLAFARLVDRTNRDTSGLPDEALDPDPPIIVGCSAGIGRTGSFVALSSLLRAHGVLQPPARPTPASVVQASPLGLLPEPLQNDMVVQEVDFLREQRPGMVQRSEQLVVIYEILSAALKSGSTGS